MLEATAKAPNWRDALKRVLRETGGDEYLLDRAHIHIRRDGRIVVEDPDTLRVYELRSEAEPGSKEARGPQELAIPTKKFSAKPEKTEAKKVSRPKRASSSEGAPDDNKTAIGAPVLVQGKDGRFHEAGVGFSQSPKPAREPEPRKPGPADTAPKIAEALPYSEPLHGPGQAGFQPVLSEDLVPGENVKGGTSNVVSAKKVPEREGGEQELPSVIVNLPEEQQVEPGKAVLKDEGSYFEISAQNPSEASDSLSEKDTDSLSEKDTDSSLPRLSDDPGEIALATLKEPSPPAVDPGEPLSLESAEPPAPKRRAREGDALRQSLPVMDAPDEFDDLRSGRTLEVVAGTFLRAIRKRVDADLGVVLVPDSRSKYVLLSAGFGLPKDFKARRFKYGDGAGGFACEYDTPIQLDDPSSRPDLIGKFEEMFPNAVSIVAFPLRFEKTTFGAVELVRTQGNPFSPEEYALLEALCEAQAAKIS